MTCQLDHAILSQTALFTSSWTFHYDVFTSLNLGFAAGAADRGVREKSLMIFSNWSMTGGHACETSA